jgi:hypothetical protein
LSDGYRLEVNQQMLLKRRRETQERQENALSKVDELLSTQRSMAKELDTELDHMQLTGSELDRLREAEEQSGLLSLLSRRFTSRRTALARRSVAEELLRQYERVSVRLRAATAFSDELRLVSLELQDELDRLHQELIDGKHDQQRAASLVVNLEERLRTAKGATPEQHAQLVDRLTFQLKSESIHLELYGAAVEHSDRHLEPARALRDTVLQLHQEMSAYVLAATHTVNSAGRRIQGLGMMADAPTVVAELQESLDELADAMTATQKYVEQSQKMLSKVLPDLTARMEAEAEVDGEALADRLSRVTRSHSREAAERALREAAHAEIDGLLD